jgi:RNA polymerase sigma-70 factor (ECF subfamily)
MYGEPRVVGELDSAFEHARSGNVDAWESVYRLCRPTLYSFARLRLATDEQAEDAVSETVARAISSADRYQPGRAGVIGWLIGINRNVVREMYRSGSRTTAVAEVRDDPFDHGPRPEDDVLRAAEHQSVRDAFGQLSDEEQTVLELRVIAGLDSEAVAELMGKGAGAIRMAQSRALHHVRTLLQGQL